VTTTGVFTADETGDLSSVQGLQAYSDRVFRRLTTPKGRFAHLPASYGSLFSRYSKQLAKAGIRELLAIDAEDQIRQEPETTSVTVRVRVDPSAPNVAYYDIDAMAGILVLRRTFTLGETR
jgi:hypothetical protein